MITGYRDAAWLPETGRPDERRGGGAGHRPQGRREGYGGALGSDLGRARTSEQGGGAVLVKPGLLHLYTLTPAGAHSVERVTYFSSSDMKVILKNEDVKSAKVAKYIEYRVQRWRSVITKWEEDRGLMPR